MAKKEISVEYKALTAQFNEAMRELNKELELTNSRYRLHAEAAKQSGNETERLAVTIQKLQEQYRLAKDKTELVAKQLEESKKLTGETSKETYNLTKQLLSAQLNEEKLKNALDNTNKQYSEAVQKTSLLAKAEEERIKNLEQLKTKIEQAKVEDEKLAISGEKNAAQYQGLQAATNHYGESLLNLRNKKQYLSEAININVDRLQNMKTQLDLTKSAYGENSLEAQKLEKEMVDLAAQTAELSRKLGGSLGESLQNLGGKMSEVGRGVKEVGTNLTQYVSVPLVGAIGGSIKAASDWESAFTGVKKTVDEVYDSNGHLVYGYKELEDALRKMSLEVPSSNKDLAALAETGGRLGIETQNVASFTRTLADLMVSTNLTVEDGADKLAKYANITQMSQKDFSRLGSTLVALGNNFATTENDIVNMSMNLAGAGKQVGMSDAQIFALAASLSSVGIQAERGGTAFSKVMVGMQLAVEKSNSKFDELGKKAGKTGSELYKYYNSLDGNAKKQQEFAKTLGLTNGELKQAAAEYKDSSQALDQFAEVAGMSAAQFKEAFQKDAANAIFLFIKGLKKTQDEGKPAIKVLDDMGITEVRMRDALLRAANGQEVFADATKVATQAWSENTALAVEAGKRYGTFESQLTLLKNEAKDIGITFGGPFVTALRDVLQASKPTLETIKGLAESFSNADKSTQQFIIKTLALTAALGPALRILGSVTNGVGKTISFVGMITEHFGKAKAPINDVAKGMLEVEKSSILMTGGLKNLSSFALGPWGLAIGGAAAGIWAFKKALDSAKNVEIAGMTQQIESFTKVANQVEPSIKDFGNIADKLKDTYDKVTYSISTNTPVVTGILKKASDERRAFTKEEFDNIQKLLGDYQRVQDAVIQSGGIKLAQRRIQIAQEKTLTDEQYAAELKSLGAYTSQVEQSFKESNEKKLTMLMEAGKRYAEAKQSGNAQERDEAKKQYDALLADYAKAQLDKNNLIQTETTKHIEFLNKRYWAEREVQLKQIEDLSTMQTNIDNLYLKSDELRRKSASASTEEQRKAYEQQIVQIEQQIVNEHSKMTQHFNTIDNETKAHYANMVFLKAANGAELNKTEQDFMNLWIQTITNGTDEAKKAMEKGMKAQLDAIYGGTEQGKKDVNAFMLEFNRALNSGDTEALKKLMTSNIMGLSSKKQDAVSAQQDIDNAIMAEIEGRKSEAKNKGAGLGQNTADGISSKVGEAGAAGAALVTSAKNAVADGYGAMYNSGRYFGQGAIDGLRSKVSGIAGAAAHFAEVAHSTLNNTWEINSPSRKAFRSGAFYGEGGVNGVLSKVEDMKKATNTLANAAEFNPDMAIDSENAYNGIIASRGIIVNNYNTLNGAADETRLANKMVRVVDKIRRNETFATGGI